MALTWIFEGASSLAKAFVKELIAPLVAEYATSHEAPTFPHTEEMLIILPEWLCKKWGTSSFDKNIGAVTFVFQI